MTPSVKFVETMVQSLLQRGAAGAEVLLREHQEDRWVLRLQARSRGGEVAHTCTRRASVEARTYAADGALQIRRLDVADLEAALALSAATLLASAVRSAAPADPLAGPPQRLDIPTQGLAINDPRLLRMGAADREDVLTWNAGIARSSARVRPQHFTLIEDQIERTYASSRGVQAEEASSRFTLEGAVQLTARADRELSGRIQSRHFADIASRPLGAELSRRLDASERTVPLEALPLVLEPPVVAAILERILPAFDANALERGESFLVGRVGTAIAPALIHLVDDATLTGGLQTRAFDDRGISPMPLPLLREGVVTGLYLDPRHARRLDQRPSGHARFDGRSWPGNLVVRPGNRTRNMLFADLGRYLMAVDLLEPPRISPSSGAVHLVLDISLEGTDRTSARVGAFQLETTIFALFQSITQMGSDQARCGSVDACTWVSEGLALTPA